MIRALIKLLVLLGLSVLAFVMIGFETAVPRPKTPRKRKKHPRKKPPE